MKKITGNEKIVDVCCGSKMFWVEKENPDVIFCDIRYETHVLCDGRVLNVWPDMIVDFTNQPFDDKSMKIVVFDPPHLVKIGDNAWMALKYGKLPKNWRELLKKGFEECWRICDDYGMIIFKWNEHQIKEREVVDAIGRNYTLGHRSGKGNKTILMIFVKIPEKTIDAA